MNLRLISKIAISGMKKNYKTIIPYFIAGIMAISIFFILASLSDCPYIYKNGVEAFYGAKQICLFLDIGIYVVGIFALVFLLYANVFVMKEKKREIGLYGILGLSKKNVATLLLFETFVYIVVCVFGGMAVGLFLNKLMLLWLYKIVGQSSFNGLFVSFKAIRNTVLLFLGIYLATFIFNTIITNTGNPIDLIKSNKTGEKEPKVKWIRVVIGAVCLIAGYVIALRTKTTLAAMSNFFIAVVLVMAGTYNLFISGSIFLLKLLKNNKEYYYRTKHFISVSNLIYRLKHNAAGLASICILSTGVIILLSCASSLMALGEQNINSMYPKDVRVDAYVANPSDKDTLKDSLVKAAVESDIDYNNTEVFLYHTATIEKTVDGIKKVGDIKNYDDCAQVYLYTLEEYKNHYDTSITLEENEIIFYCSKTKNVKNFTINGKEYIVKDELHLEAVNATTMVEMSLFDAYYIVVHNLETLDSLNKELASFEVKEGYYNVLAGFNTRGDLSDEQINSIKKELAQYGEYVSVGFKQEDRVFFYNTYGGTFFVGMFLAILFLMATVMIIYYKQMAEGMEDQKRYQILMNVGLTKEEIQKTIKNQVMLLFFLPVVTAILHMAFASNIVRLFLSMILPVETKTFILAIAIVCIIFLVIYALVYKITSIQYYKIVKGE